MHSSHDVAASAKATRTPSPGAPEVLPITAADIPDVSEFMSLGMASARSPADWRATMAPPWDLDQPNSGYLMRENGRIVGAYLASYSVREIDGRRRRICNLGAWCVDEQHRATGLRMLRSLLRQRGYTFTDLTPNADVVALNTRLGFVALDTSTAMVLNMAWPVRSRAVRIVDSPGEIDKMLSGNDQQIYRDHVATAAHQVVATRGDRNCLIVFRRDSYRRLPLFATILHVSTPDVFGDCAPDFYRYLLVRRGIPATLVEMRVVGHRPSRSMMVAGRPKMFSSDDLTSAQIDYLYSELTCLP
jgi:hypothetical protein